MKEQKSTGFHAQRYILTGLLTIIPLWVTWLIFTFVLGQLITIGAPWAGATARQIEEHFPKLASWLLEPWLQFVLAVLFTLILLYLIGWAATLVVGKRVIAWFESLVERIPFVKTIYGATRKMLETLQQKPERVQRVVLINFPSPEMKVVGFVTSTFFDEGTSQQLAAVYVPTAPNPTSGYIEILPVERITSTNWTVDEALTFIVTAGAIAPQNLTYSGSASAPSAAALAKTEQRSGSS
ncbi:MAG: DUF502 domain-containing protein [Burkholderiales bacterium]